MSADFIIRIFGMAVFSIVGVYVGNGLSVYNPDQQLFYTITFTLVGALLGLILTPYVTTRPIRALRAVLGRLAA
ncbi:MAG: PIN domain nuclease, partial [Anaerolineales bacterium]